MLSDTVKKLLGSKNPDDQKIAWELVLVDPLPDYTEVIEALGDNVYEYMYYFEVDWSKDSSFIPKSPPKRHDRANTKKLFESFRLKIDVKGWNIRVNKNNVP